jgi:hypothetical protein
MLTWLQFGHVDCHERHLLVIHHLDGVSEKNYTVEFLPISVSVFLRLNFGLL